MRDVATTQDAHFLASDDDSIGRDHLYVSVAHRMLSPDCFFFIFNFLVLLVRLVIQVGFSSGFISCLRRSLKLTVNGGVNSDH
jgi:hypothetical protein